MSTLSQFFGGGGSSTLPIPLSPNAFRIDTVVVGGGGAPSSNGFLVGGGGAGRVLQVFGILVEKNKTYPITIGQGGTGSNNGGDTIFSGLIAQGGGTRTSQSNGVGGSGAYASATIFSSLATYNASSLVDGSQLLSYGNSGGFGGAANVSLGGGGGAGGVGGNTSTAGAGGDGGNGGPGVRSFIPSDAGIVYGAGGGSGGAFSNGAPTGNGTDGTGNGGGVLGTRGGNGVVVVAYPNTIPLATTIGAPLLFSASNPAGANATRAGYHVYVFNGSGSITFN